MTVKLPHMPVNISHLPKDSRGYPVPWFIQWMKDGEPTSFTEKGAEPDFRVMNTNKRIRAYKNDLCWICGRPLGQYRFFVVGPMCVINRVSSEPPSHRDCAEFAVKACPFLVRPRMRRLPMDDLPEESKSGPGGIMLPRNPGCTALYLVLGKDYRAFDAGNGWLIQMGITQKVYWYSEGRTATREEVLESITSGYPFLYKLAVKDGKKSVKDLEKMRDEALKLVPTE